MFIDMEKYVSNSLSSNSKITSTLIKIKHHVVFAIKEVQISNKNRWWVLLFGEVGVE